MKKINIFQLGAVMLTSVSFSTTSHELLEDEVDYSGIETLFQESDLEETLETGSLRDSLLGELLKIASEKAKFRESGITYADLKKIPLILTEADVIKLMEDENSEKIKYLYKLLKEYTSTAFRINYDAAATTALNAVNSTRQKLNDLQKQLSTGLRINTVFDEHDKSLNK